VRGGSSGPPKRVFPQHLPLCAAIGRMRSETSRVRWAGNRWMPGTCTVTTGKSRLFWWWRASEPFGSGCYSASELPPPNPSREPPFFVRPNRRRWECQEQSRKEVGGIHKNKDHSSLARRVGKLLEVGGRLLGRRPSVPLFKHSCSASRDTD
jgi:hypothetical protein